MKGGLTFTPLDVRFVIDAQTEPPERVVAAARVWSAAATSNGVTLKMLGDLTGIRPLHVVAIVSGSAIPTRSEAHAIDVALGTDQALKCYPLQSVSVLQSASKIAPRLIKRSTVMVEDVDRERAARWRDLMSTERRQPTSIARGAGLSHARLRKLVYEAATPTEGEIAALDAYLGFGRRTLAKRVVWEDEITSVALNVADVVRRARLDPVRGRKIIAGDAVGSEAERLALTRVIERERERLA